MEAKRNLVKVEWLHQFALFEDHMLIFCVHSFHLFHTSLQCGSIYTTYTSLCCVHQLITYFHMFIILFSNNYFPGVLVPIFHTFLCCAHQLTQKNFVLCESFKISYATLICTSMFTLHSSLCCMHQIVLFTYFKISFLHHSTLFTHDIDVCINSPLQTPCTVGINQYIYTSSGMRFPIMWHFEMCRLGRACAASG